MEKDLEILETVELRDYWEKEEELTDWLTKEENIELLAGSIGIDLEDFRTQQSAGEFKIDILAKDSDTERYVVIENQLERSDHKHLGQLLAYASDRNASTVVWIAKEIRDEHRTALDWLNEHTSDVVFFGIEIELWKIGESKAAPHFRIVSQPNNWSRMAKSKDSDGANLTETKILRKEFWTQLKDYMEKKQSFLHLGKPSYNHWSSIFIGLTGFHISLTLKVLTSKIGCELYMSSSVAKKAFAALFEEKEDVESELNGEVEWKELPDKGASVLTS